MLVTESNTDRQPQQTRSGTDTNTDTGTDTDTDADTDINKDTAHVLTCQSQS